MGVMTFLQMQTELRFVLDNRQDLTAAQLSRWLNFAYFHIAQPHIHRHHQLFVNYTGATLVLDDVDYAIDPTTVGFQILGIHSVYYIDSATATSVTAARQRLRFVDLRAIDSAATGGWPTGRPTSYSVMNNLLVLDRRPTSVEVGDTLLVRCYRSPTTLSADADLTVLPPVWDEVLVAGAAYRGWRQLNQPDRAELSRGEFVALANDVTEFYQIAGEDWGGSFSLDYVPFMDGRG